MKQRKQSIREIADAALIARSQPEIAHMQESLDAAAADPIGATRRGLAKRIDRPIYVRGAKIDHRRRENRK